MDEGAHLRFFIVLQSPSSITPPCVPLFSSSTVRALAYLADASIGFSRRIVKYGLGIVHEEATVS